MKIKQHLQRYIGWYFLVASLGLIIGEEYFTGFLIGLITLLKIPPFDWIGRAYGLGCWNRSLLGIETEKLERETK